MLRNLVFAIMTGIVMIGCGDLNLTQTLKNRSKTLYSLEKLI